MKKLTQKLQADDIKEIYTSLTVLYNERLKADKEKTKKKKAPVVKKTLNMKEDELDGGEYDEYSDFM